MDARFSVDEVRLSDLSLSGLARPGRSPLDHLNERVPRVGLLDHALLLLALSPDGLGCGGFSSFVPASAGGQLGFDGLRPLDGDRGGPKLWELLRREEGPLLPGGLGSSARTVASNLLYGYGGSAANLIAASKGCLWGPLGLERRLGALLEGVPNSSRRRAHAWIDFAVRNGFLLPPRGEVSLFPISCPLWDDLCAAGVVVEIPRRVGAGRVRHAWRSLGELRIEEAADEIARFLARA